MTVYNPLEAELVRNFVIEQWFSFFRSAILVGFTQYTADWISQMRARYVAAHSQRCSIYGAEAVLGLKETQDEDEDEDIEGF